jgi:cytidylate kinase
VDPCVVAVDGPSGSGKSTVSRQLALALQARYLDTGAMYRAVTLAVLNADVDPSDAATVAKVAHEVRLDSGTDPAGPFILIDAEPVDQQIRSAEVTAAVSAVAAVPTVRALLVARQRQIIAHAGRIVVEGRDIGSVVAPDAHLKVFLTADPGERARRRSAEQATSVSETAAALARRDHLDSTRATDPFAQPADAVVVDTTGLPIDDVVQRLCSLVAERLASAASAS